MTAPHWHVAAGLAGYGPDAADTDGFPTFETLGEALEYARDELSTYVDMAHEGAHGFAEQQQYEQAWDEIIRMERLEILRANLDPARKQAPLYVNDDAAYAALQESQAADFSHDVTHSSRIYLWDCSETECVEDRPEETDGYVNEPSHGSCVVSLDGRLIGTAEDVDAAFRLLAHAMRDGSYWPNAWHVNERGNTTLVVIEDYDTGACRFTDTAYV